ncbi:hypothetical protein PENCOP_c005G05905 [Penicillium coprophilum]|uniref:D-xylose reductase [NAD(P)H] n=1 Tax=Penicillium coprophilum TaxID=36646 RepID=A0A1V6URF1_9EURO|nr:hypothetical protein PENCOP_c005G05905 [Penicillium coprophilum]
MANSRSTVIRWSIFSVGGLVTLAIIFNLFQQFPPLSVTSGMNSEEYKPAPLLYIPPLGLGTWQISKSKTSTVVKFAIEKGYRHIDAALIYGNEKEVGEGITQSGIPRSSLWVTGKLWNDAHEPSLVRPAVIKTLEDLGLEYLDLYLVHWPVAFKPGTGRKIFIDNVNILETWRAMEELVKEGLVRQIGVSNFNQAQVEQILRHARIRPSAHELETHPFLQQSAFVDWNLAQGLRVIAYSPLGNMNPIYEASDTPLLQDPFLTPLAQKNGVTVAQLSLSWNMHRGVVVIPKSEHKDRVFENLQAQFVRLSDDDVQAINAYDQKARFNNPIDTWGVQLYGGLDGV